jgi:hypothetical protein
VGRQRRHARDYARDYARDWMFSTCTPVCATRTSCMSSPKTPIEALQFGLVALG